MIEIKKPKIIQKAWGEEIQIANTFGYCGKILKVSEGYRSSIHRHEKDETFYELDGEIYAELGENPEDLEGVIFRGGGIIHIPINMWHRFSGLEDSRIIEFSTPDVESGRYIGSGKIPNFYDWREEIRLINRKLKNKKLAEVLK